MNCVRFKSDVTIVPSPGGARIISALDQATQKLGVDLIVTAGSNGQHSGPNDPHYRGDAYDVRSHDFDAILKEKVIAVVMDLLGYDCFYGFIEAAGTDNEHYHIQVKKGTVYPPDPSSTNADSGAGGNK